MSEPSSLASTSTSSSSSSSPLRLPPPEGKGKKGRGERGDGERESSVSSSLLKAPSFLPLPPVKGKRRRKRQEDRLEEEGEGENAMGRRKKSPSSLIATGISKQQRQFLPQFLGGRFRKWGRAIEGPHLAAAESRGGGENIFGGKKINQMRWWRRRGFWDWRGEGEMIKY